MAENQQYITDKGSGWIKPTNELRFIPKNGFRVLQQKWVTTYQDYDGGKLVGASEVEKWIDVPYVENPQEGSA